MPISSRLVNVYRVQIPLLRRHSWLILHRGQVIELTLLWTTRAHWRTRRRAGWIAWSLGPFVVAFRLR